MRDKRWPAKESRDICEMSGGGYMGKVGTCGPNKI